MKIVVIGNCQVFNVAKFLRLSLPGADIALIPVADVINDDKRDAHLHHLKDADFIFSQPLNNDRLEGFSHTSLKENPKATLFPIVYFSGFHPDCIYVTNKTSKLLIQSPIGAYNSSIAVSSFINGLSVDETVQLYNEQVYEELGFFDVWDVSKSVLLSDFSKLGLDVSELFEKWAKQGVFMYTMNHPYLSVLNDIGRMLLKKVDLTPDISLLNPEKFMLDGASSDVVWPVYPELASRQKIAGEMHFKIADKLVAPKVSPALLDLREFIEKSFEIFGKEAPGSLHFWGVYKDKQQSLEVISKFSTTLKERGKTGKKSDIKVLKDQKNKSVRTRAATGLESKETESNPYNDLAPHQFWRKTFANRHYGTVDPVVSAPFKVSKEDKIVTAGSCFAQHIARRLQQAGYNYYVSERLPKHMDEQAGRDRNYAVYSARYGNIYTVKQFAQLIDRAYGRHVPKENAWSTKSGRFVDPFRPQIEPGGFDTVVEMLKSQDTHFAAVRDACESADVFVLTLGLTEGWVSKIDGSVFPLAPGVVAGQFDDEKHEFANYSVKETTLDLKSALHKLSEINDDFKVILTVSPVPLIATKEPRHVLTSTTLSKSVLRAAADEICREFDNVYYFPSYEIITGSYTRGQYFDDDLRTVTPQGVDHVMKLFFKHLTNSDTAGNNEHAADNRSGEVHEDQTHTFSARVRMLDDIVCDEEAIDGM